MFWCFRTFLLHASFKRAEYFTPLCSVSSIFCASDHILTGYIPTGSLLYICIVNSFSWSVCFFCFLYSDMFDLQSNISEAQVVTACAFTPLNWILPLHVSPSVALPRSSAGHRLCYSSFFFFCSCLSFLLSVCAKPRRWKTTPKAKPTEAKTETRAARWRRSSPETRH